MRLCFRAFVLSDSALEVLWKLTSQRSEYALLTRFGSATGWPLLYSVCWATTARQHEGTKRGARMRLRELTYFQLFR